MRRLVGYDRYASQAAYAQLARLYADLRLYVNFFQPLRKMVQKTRHGARVTKRYDQARTPYQRLRASGLLEVTTAGALERQYQALDPLALRQEIDRALASLWKLAERQTAR